MRRLYDCAGNIVNFQRRYDKMEKGVLWGIAIVLAIALYCGFVIRRL